MAIQKASIDHANLGLVGDLRRVSDPSLGEVGKVEKVAVVLVASVVGRLRQQSEDTVAHAVLFGSALRILLGHVTGSDRRSVGGSNGSLGLAWPNSFKKLPQFTLDKCASRRTLNCLSALLLLRIFFPFFLLRLFFSAPAQLWSVFAPDYTVTALLYCTYVSRVRRNVLCYQVSVLLLRESSPPRPSQTQ